MKKRVSKSGRVDGYYAPEKIVRPRGAIGKPLTKSEIYAAIAESTQLTKKDVEAVFAALAEEIKKSLGKKGPGVFKIPDLVKLTRKKKDAIPARQIKNPFTGEMITVGPRRASVAVGVRALRSLKEIVD